MNSESEKISGINPDEAVSRFDLMIEDPDPSVRSEALKVAFFIPPDRLKPRLFKHLARESDPGIFEKLLLHIAINPDVEVPYRLYELAESAAPDRRKVLLSAIRDSCGSLQASGALEGDFDAAMTKLQAWAQKRWAARFVRQCLMEGMGLPQEGSTHLGSPPGGGPAQTAPSGRLASYGATGTAQSLDDTSVDGPDNEKFRRLADLVRQFRNRPEVNLAFEEALAGPLSDEQKSILSNIVKLSRTEEIVISRREGCGPTALGERASGGPISQGGEAETAAGNIREPPMSGAGGPNEQGDGKPVWEQQTQKSRESKFREIASLAFRGREMPPSELSAHLLEALSQPDSELVATAIRTATRIKFGGIVPEVIPLLRKSDPLVVGASLEYLATFAPDEVFPRLGTFLLSNHQRVKRTAIDVLRKVDPAQAVSRLRVLLFDSNYKQQEAALGCLVSFDFPLIRDLLGEFLRSRPDSCLFARGLDLFAIFPDSGNLEILYDLSRKCSPEAASVVGKVIASTETALCEMSLIKAADLPKLHLDREKKWKEKEATKNPPPSPAGTRGECLGNPPPGGEPKWADPSFSGPSISVRKDTPEQDLSHQKAQKTQTFWIMNDLFIKAFEGGGFQMILKSGIMGLLLAGLISIFPFSGEEVEQTSAPGAVLQQNVSFSGVLLGVEGTAEEARATVRAEDGKMWYLIDQGNSRLGSFKEGSRMNLVASPFRVNESGTIIGNILECSPQSASQ